MSTEERPDRRDLIAEARALLDPYEPIEYDPEQDYLAHLSDALESALGEIEDLAEIARDLEIESQRWGHNGFDHCPSCQAAYQAKGDTPDA